MKGMTLRDAMARSGDTLMGPAHPAGEPFPILVKWLDCRERLSLQVHPPANAAAIFGGDPKSENWYIADATAGAAVFIGMQHRVTRAQFESAIRLGAVETLVHRVAVRAGDSVFVPSGRVHAIDAGNLILEIQENSDTIYRVFDWNRPGLDGKPRELHIEKSLASITFDDVAPEVRTADSKDPVLADCPHFRIRRFFLQRGERLPTKETSAGPWLIHVVSGVVEERLAGERMAGGDNALAPYANPAMVEALEESVVLITDQFSLPISG
jgi:mannose-6-phosphate isomerase